MSYALSSPRAADPVPVSGEVGRLKFAALRLHQQGKLAEAEPLYREILASAPGEVEALHALGVLELQKRRFEEADRLIAQVLAIKPDNAAALNNRGTALRGLGRFDEALASYDKALSIKADFAEGMNNRGNALRELGRLEEALASYEKALAIRPTYAEACCNRGNILRDLGRPEEALASFDAALVIQPNHAAALHHRGNALLKLLRVEEAVASYDRALELRPDHPEGLNNRAVALLRLGRHQEALTSADRALVINPDYAEALSNRAIALLQLGRSEEALQSYDKTLSIRPDFFEAHGYFAAALQRVGKFDEAATHYQRALELQPDHVGMHCGLAAVLQQQGRLSDAIARYEQALVLDHDSVTTHIGIGAALEQEGKPGDATAHYERALALRPDLPILRFRLCMAQLPILYLDEGEIEGRRDAYRRRLEQLCRDVEERRTTGDLVSAVGSNQPFFLPYQGRNDRDLQSRYGALQCRIIADHYPAAPMPPPPAPDEKVRVGIVSGLFRHHTVWKLMIKGWLSQLDRRKFEVFCYHTGADRDLETEFAVSRCDRFVQGPLPGNRWREEILADRPHILLYPDIGMDPGSAWLAAHRLAPTQCVSWGHPNTTGYPTIDYFLSSALMEPPEADQHYTEHLIRLPNLSIYYEPLDLPPLVLGREQLGLRPSAVVYWCGQSLFKYLPQFDQVFPRIAREVGDCQFVFIASNHGDAMSERLRRRLDRAFAVFGLDAAKHCLFLSRLDVNRFVAAIGECDVVLDSLGWSGGNTTLEGLVHGTPIVTLAGPMMRGRHTTAILTMIGVTDTIAETVDDYVSIAVRLGRDPPWRMALKQRMSEHKHRVYRDRDAIAALEDFLCRVARSDRDAIAALEDFLFRVTRREFEPEAKRQAAEGGPRASVLAISSPLPTTAHLHGDRP